MTFVPILVGTVFGGPQWEHVLLVFSWTVAFLFFNAFGLFVKARRKNRYRAAVTTYGCVAGIGAAFLLWWHPGLWVWGPPLALLFLWAVAEILHRNERSLGARISAILASCLMAPVAYSLGTHPYEWTRLWIVTTVLAAYFVGTVPYVKTLIRERGNHAWLVGSLAYHAVLVVVSLVCVVAHVFEGTTAWLVPLTALVLLGRAWLYPWVSERRGGPLDPKVIGLSEFGFCALVVVAILV